jgi:hypothetical protein
MAFFATENKENIHELDPEKVLVVAVFLAVLRLTGPPFTSAQEKKTNIWIQ